MCSSTEGGDRRPEVCTYMQYIEKTAIMNRPSPFSISMYTYKTVCWFSLRFQKKKTTAMLTETLLLHTSNLVVTCNH